MSDIVRYAADSLGVYMAALPWFLPAMALVSAAGVPMSALVASLLRARRSLGYVLILSLGAVLAATLLPGAMGFDRVEGVAGACHLHRIGLATAHDYLSVTETSLNVVLLIPLGVVLALLPRSRRSVALVLVAFALPLGIELTQLIVPSLGRACESADVVDNVLGLALGLTAGAIARGATR